MPANQHNIHIPIDPDKRRWGEYLDYERSKVPWQRPWKFGGESRMPGKHFVVTNNSFTDQKGQHKTWDPLLVACHYLRRAQEAGADVIRVHTPKYEGESGNQALADLQVKVSALENMPHLFPQFFKQVKDGELKLEDEAVSTMPTVWKSTESGIFYPQG